VPDEVHLVGAVTGALLPLTQEYNWEQFGSMTPAEAAGIMLASFEEFVAGNCASDCPPRWRQNSSNGRWEIYNGDLGTWEFPDGVIVESIPLPEPREEETEADKICNAAANAANVLYLTWQKLNEDWDNNVEAPLANAALAVETGLTLGAAFFPPLEAAAALVGTAFGFIFGLFQLIQIDTWSPAFIQKLTCILAADATVDENGRVLFNHVHVIQEVNLLSWQDSQYLLVAIQLQFLLSWLGSEALNVAGGLTAVTGDCAECGEWCYVWDFPVERGTWFPVRLWTDFNAASGYYTGEVWQDSHTIQDTSPTDSGHSAVAVELQVDAVLTEVVVNYDRPSINYHGATGNVAFYIALNGTTGTMSGDIYGWEASPGETGLGLQKTIALSEVPVSSVQVQVRCGYWPLSPSEPGGAACINWIQLRGVGDNPFGADNCE